MSREIFCSRKEKLSKRRWRASGSAGASGFPPCYDKAVLFSVWMEYDSTFAILCFDGKAEGFAAVQVILSELASPFTCPGPSLLWFYPFPRPSLVAMNTAAMAPSPSAVRNDGFGSHFIAPRTISGGSFACGAELVTRCCR